MADPCPGPRPRRVLRLFHVTLGEVPIATSSVTTLTSVGNLILSFLHGRSGALLGTDLGNECSDENAIEGMVLIAQRQECF
jgi:hypothetical protein